MKHLASIHPGEYNSKIKVTYKKLAWLLHPDKWKSNKLFTEEEGGVRSKYI